MSCILLIIANLPFTDLGALKAGKHLSLSIVRALPFTTLELRTANSSDSSRLVLELDGSIAGCCPASVSVLPGAISMLGE